MNEKEFINSDFAGCKILEKIGQGGMGSVYKAFHNSLNKTVCVKILSRELAADQRNIEFFMREARSASKLDHPNIVHVYSFGEEKGLYYIVMSYVEGKTLEDILKEKKVLTIPEATDYIIGILRGLAHAHSKNIIHRDIKPSNILVTKDNIPRIADFGLAKSVTEEKQLTIAGEMVGTAYFMSPEQGLAAKVDTRADLYAVGATYFYLISGKYPYEGKSSVEVISKHINEPLPNLYQLIPDIPIWTAKVIEKLMKKNPDERYQKAQEVLDELTKYKENNYSMSVDSKEHVFDFGEIKEKAKKEIQIEKPMPNNTNVNKTNNQNPNSTEQKSKTNETSARTNLRISNLNKTLRFTYHFGFLFFSMFFAIYAGTFSQKTENFLYNFYSPFFNSPLQVFSLFLLSFIMLFFAIKSKPNKFTFYHFIISLLMILFAYASSSIAQVPYHNDNLSQIFYNLKLFFSSFNFPSNYWAISIIMIALSYILKNSQYISIRLFSFLAIFISFFVFTLYIQNTLNSGFSLEKNLFILAFILAFLSSILQFYKKSFLLIINPLTLMLLSFYLIFNAYAKPLQNSIFKEKEELFNKEYSQELKIYQSKINIYEYDEEGKAIRKYKNLKEPIMKSKEEIKNIADLQFWQSLKNANLKDIDNNGIFILISVFMFILNNLIFLIEIKTKEEAIIK